MNSSDFVLGKLRTWAMREGIQLQGSAGARGAPNYTMCLDANLYGRGLLPQVRRSFEEGAGGELDGEIPSMLALHSSAAMAVNLFQHWVKTERFSVLAKILNIPAKGIDSVTFERKYPVCSDPKAKGFREPPHLDVGIEYTDSSRVGVECKLFEPYGRLQHAPLKKPYLALEDAWRDIPACRALAEDLAAGRSGFRRLGPEQLLKHILGLKYDRSVSRVRLIYLFFDSPGEEAAEHRSEISRFQELIKSDPVRFVPMEVQEFLLRAVQHCSDPDADYLRYVTSRYL